jgi:RNA polymerase sigma factor (sigma-70 family)
MIPIKERNIFIEGHYRLNYHRLVNFMGKRIGQNNAEDAVQEAYCRALQYFDSYRPGEDFDAWFMAIWENAGRKTMNDTSNDEDVEELAGTLSVPPMAEQTYELSAIQDKLNDERPDHRMAIILHLILGFTKEEAGQQTGLEGNNVGVIVNRFRERLK